MTTIAADELTPDDLRRAFGSLPTGVVALTGDEGGVPVGMTVGTFASLSLVPPLVTFSVDTGSTTWPRMRALGRFTANVLASHQGDVARTLARRGTDKFADVSSSAGTGHGVHIDGAVAHVALTLVQEVEAGDHWVVVASIASFTSNGGEALLFRGGTFGRYIEATPDPG